MAKLPHASPLRRIWPSFDLGTIEFDRRKSEHNLQERGFDFAFAARIFLGEVLARLDTRHEQEARHQAIGEFSGHVLFVVYVVRAGRCRIISARQATVTEAALFDDR